MTDRYTRAIEQLGSDKLDVRIGGIYALERVARDSARDYPTVVDVLTAFVRVHSREEWEHPADDQPGAGLPELVTRPDVDAAVIFIVSRNPEHDRRRVNLTAANLAGANLLYANLSEAILNGAVLTGAHLGHANLTGLLAYNVNLTGADLTLADLTGATLPNASCANARFLGAKLTGANLTGADLTGADLANARLNRARLTGAVLTGADLQNATFKKADLAGVNLTGARWPPKEAVPQGWERDPDSGLLRPAEGESRERPLNYFDLKNLRNWIGPGAVLMSRRESMGCRLRLV
jgi:hypothetical protein